MIDPAFIRNNPDKIKALVKSGRASAEKVDVDKWLKLDEQRLKLILELEKLNHGKNQLAEKGKAGQTEELKEEGKRLKEQTKELETRRDEINKEWQEILDWMPNIPLEEVPMGKDEKDNVEIKAWEPTKGYLAPEKLKGYDGSAEHMSKIGAHSDFDKTPKPHWEIGKDLDIIDIEAGAKVSGSRFYYLKKDGALLIYAIFDLLRQKLLQEGFDPMIVPVLVKEKALYGASQFPGDADQVYKIQNDYVEEGNQLYLIGSSEPANFAYFMDKTLKEEELPVKVMATTSCFRSEVGSWGKDVRGIKRTHQFDKLEMNMIIKADLDEARKTHEYLLSLNEWLLQELELPYHVINMCYGDLGYYAAAKKYDVEVWIPSQNAYMEVMSDSITTDYQTRRLNIKYKDAEGKTKLAYTLNDTGATHRLLIAIIEHYQQADGSIFVPKALQRFMSKTKISKAQ